MIRGEGSRAWHLKITGVLFRYDSTGRSDIIDTTQTLDR